MMAPMKFRHELTYDAGPAEVFEMLADPAFRKASVAAQDVVTAEVHLEREGNGFRLTIDQEQRTADLPSFARAITGDTTHAVQREHWEDSTGGTLRVDAPGKPSEVRGTITLRPEGSQTREIVELELRVKVPVLGGRLEKLLAERLAASLDAEHGVGVAWLKGER
jgi:uncharacterized protein YndB with AHSA1/START domain